MTNGEVKPVAPEPVGFPMDSAPMDGTEALGWREDCGWFVMRYTSCDAFLTDREIDETEEALLFQKDWFAADFIHGSRLEGSELPTRWLPMPGELAPQAQQATYHLSPAEQSVMSAALRKSVVSVEAQQAGSQAATLTYEEIADMLQDHARDSKEMHEFARAIIAALQAKEGQS